MSDGAKTLAYSGYFLGRLQPCLIRARETKEIENNWATSFIVGISARDTFIWSIFVGAVTTEDTFA